ncbi:MAG: hypothetical protein LH479_06775, partial [Polaromonas sp.]|nr:hypothetical protein [Polaromonas sp.]
TTAWVLLVFFLGAMCGASLVASQIGLEGGFWAGLNALNDSMADFGVVVVGIFLVSWTVSVLVYRRGVRLAAPRQITESINR